MSNQNQDAIDNSVSYQALHEDWDNIFRGKIDASAGCVDDEEEVHQNEANKFFTPTKKWKATDINDQTLNTQMFLRILRDQRKYVDIFYKGRSLGIPWYI
jgi:hypothetical protein